MQFLAALLALGGHGAFWIGLVNRLHALGWPRFLVKTGARLAYLVCLLLPLALYSGYAGAPWPTAGSTDLWPDGIGWRVYVVGCWCILAAAAVRLLWLRWGDAARQAVPQTAIPIMPELHVPQPVVGWRWQLLARIPGNQLLCPQFVERTLHIPDLPAALSGLTILHLADLHHSGRIAANYLQELVRRAAQAADIVVLTGDLCDRGDLIDQTAEILAPLGGRLGKYFVLGNHDLRTRDVPLLRAAMTAHGWVDLGVGVASAEVAGLRILLAGDERPWFPAGAESTAPLTSLTRASDFAILAAHTPDRLGWARRAGFQLMLAGHTHGGQVCFPVIGPVLCPSWHGVRFASGVFYLCPTTLHVTRGAASLFPARWNCPPEIVRLTLRPA